MSLSEDLIYGMLRGGMPFEIPYFVFTSDTIKRNTIERAIENNLIPNFDGEADNEIPNLINQIIMIQTMFLIANE